MTQGVARVDRERTAVRVAGLDAEDEVVVGRMTQGVASVERMVRRAEVTAKEDIVGRYMREGRASKGRERGGVCGVVGTEVRSC
jgi:hypothetical protein